MSHNHSHEERYVLHSVPLSQWTVKRLSSDLSQISAITHASSRDITHYAALARALMGCNQYGYLIEYSRERIQDLYQKFIMALSYL